MSGEDAFFPDAEGGGDTRFDPSFDTGSGPSASYMPPTTYGEEHQYDSMSQGLDAMPAPSYQPRPTDPYSLEESAEVMEMVQAKFEAAVSARAKKEAAAAAEVRRRAEEELDGFYDQRTDEVARRQARSREQEEAFLRGVNASIEESISNPWSRVCDLIDLQGPLPPASGARSSRLSSTGGSGGGVGGASSSRRSSARDAGLNEEDAFRVREKMRSLIIQMKADTAHSTDDAG